MIFCYEVTRVTEERYSVEIEAAAAPSSDEIKNRAHDPASVRVLRERVRRRHQAERRLNSKIGDFTRGTE